MKEQYHKREGDTGKSLKALVNSKSNEGELNVSYSEKDDYREQTVVDIKRLGEVIEHLECAVVTSENKVNFLGMDKF